MLLMANRTVFVFLHFLSLLLLQSYLSSFATAKISNITTDQSALLALKAYISHDPYHLLTRNWSTSVSVCNWVGVTCGSKHHRVTALNLSYVGFVGIFLGANKLSGSMPSTFFNMPSLQAIDLVDNKLSGALPMLMFDNLPNIQYFSITGNQFSGQLPPTLHKCRELQILSLSRNYFTGRLLPETGNLTMLIELYLGDNNFEDLVGHISDFGISKLLSDGVSLTQTMTLATIGYMAPEYGSEGVVSTMGDVYSFGILLMETFTKKKPTDDMFSEGMSLKKLVEESMLSLSVVEVADAKLLRNESDYVAMEECLSLTMGLALGCCTDSPEQRIDTKNISTTLNKIKLKFLKNIGG